MQRLLTEVEKAEIIEREWAKARAGFSSIASLCGRRLGKLRRQRQPTPWASISFTPRMTDYPRESNDTPSEYAFCCVARSVRLSDFAIFTRGVF